mmetsp:Transcript_145/g.444  ORF Transcript_145/g.444 Transcript_145/m.444 type:complete len:217 (+) Transcript_145:246-896(+)
MVDAMTVAVAGAGLAAVVTGLYAFLGGLRKVEVVRSRTPFTKTRVVYKLFFGSYSNLSEWFKEVFDLLDNESKCPTIGIYYDDPGQLKRDYGSDKDARALLGISIDDIPAEKREEVKRRFEAKGYKEREIMGGEAAEADFRLRGGLLTIPSILVYASKVYPKLEEFRQKNNLPPSGALEYSVGYKLRVFTPFDKAVADDWFLPEIVEKEPAKLYGR